MTDLFTAGGVVAMLDICGRDTPRMWPWAAELVREIGVIVAPAGDDPGRMMLGMEGNSIFLASIVCLYLCLPIGMSTLFGATGLVDSRDFTVGFRVTWHFLMNLLPMPFAMVGILEYVRRDARPL